MTFKQYTKNHAYEAMKFTEKEKTETENILSVSLKDLEHVKTSEA